MGAALAVLSSFATITSSLFICLFLTTAAVATCLGTASSGVWFGEGFVLSKFAAQGLCGDFVNAETRPWVNSRGAKT